VYQARLRGLVVGVLVSLLASVAQADVRTEARRYFRQGMALVAEGNVEEGVAALQQAYEILPHPNVLYNIGRAYAESGRYAQAIEYFQRYIDSDPPDRAEVVGFLNALRARIDAMEARAREADAPPPEQPTPAVDPATVNTGLVASEE
jgi:tetratricopeptide (TPR) repeat protein